MSEKADDQGANRSDAGDAARPPVASETRRRLMLGVASASTVITIRPALASTVGSVMNCQIPVPDPKLGAGKWIDPAGVVVDPGTPGAFRPPSRPIQAEHVKAAMRGANFPGADYESSRAYMAYIRKLQNGMSGFTCYQSLQMPLP